MIRLTFLSILLASFCFSCAQQKLTPANEVTDISTTTFLHGVASGDPLTDKVIIWTRLSDIEQSAVSASWEVSKTKDFKKIAMSGNIQTSDARDYTIKVDVDKLDAGTFYYYRFKYSNSYSPIGRTKTLSSKGTESVNLGIVSCSNYEFGYFNAYNGLAAEDLDAILFLGDYIYEYGPDKYGDKDFSRKHLPPHEILTIGDYRTRYAQYRTDVALQNAHQAHPFIMIWDDHEIANNAYREGAQNHQEDEGDFMKRKLIARRAYYEWQPIRETTDKVHYRSFQFGELANIIMLDERYEGRAAPPETKELASVERTMLGQTQLSWFKSALKNSSSKWNIIGNQVIFSPCDLSVVRPDSPINLDAWDGYAFERDDIISYLSSNQIEGTIFVTGDTHSSWAFEVPSDVSNYKKDGNSCAIEIGTTSITSANWDESVTTAEVRLSEQALIASNAHLKYVNGSEHGYVVLRLGQEQATAQWFYTDDIKHEKANITLAKEFSISGGKLSVSE